MAIFFVLLLPAVYHPPCWQEARIKKPMYSCTKSQLFQIRKGEKKKVHYYYHEDQTIAEFTEQPPCIPIHARDKRCVGAQLQLQLQLLPAEYNTQSGDAGQRQGRVHPPHMAEHDRPRKVG